MSPESRARLINKGTRLDKRGETRFYFMEVEMTNRIIFIGGPRDGELMDVQDSVIACGAIDVPTIWSRSTLEPPDLLEPVPFSTHKYRVQKTIDSDAKTVLWLAVSQDIDSDHIMAHILKVYSDART